MGKLIQGGALYVDKWLASDGSSKEGERILACSQAISLSQSPQEAVAYCNDEGAIEKSDLTTVRLDRTISTELLEIIPENLALALISSYASLSQAGSAAETESFTGVTQGLWYQLGATQSRPEGVRQVSSFSITSPGVPVVNVDYEVDLVNARWRPIVGSAVIATGADVDVQYDIDAAAIARVIPAAAEIIASVRLVGQVGSAGSDAFSWYWEKARVRASDQVVLKPSPEETVFQRVGLQIEPLKRANYPVFVGNGIPVV